MLISVLGFTQHQWPSVERTRLFYHRALSAEYEIIAVNNREELARGPQPDAILNFAGRTGWELYPRPQCPIVFVAVLTTMIMLLPPGWLVGASNVQALSHSTVLSGQATMRALVSNTNTV